MCQPSTPEPQMAEPEVIELVGGAHGAQDQGAPVMDNIGSHDTAAGGAPDRPDSLESDWPRRAPRSPVRRGQSPPASPRSRARRPLLELVVVPWTPAIQAAEDALSLALLALVVGTRSAVTPAMVLAHLVERYGVMDGRVTMRRTRPDDFIVRFSHREDLEMVLRSLRPSVAVVMGSVGAFWFRVLIDFKGIPSHARSMETAQIILGSSCTNIDIANPEAATDPDDERELFVAAWCAHPNLVPEEKIMAVPEPEEEHDGGPPLFLQSHEIIHNGPVCLEESESG